MTILVRYKKYAKNSKGEEKVVITERLFSLFLYRIDLPCRETGAQKKWEFTGADTNFRRIVR